MTELSWKISRIWDDSWEGFGETWTYPYEENRYATRDEAEAAARRHIEGEVFWSDPPDARQNDTSSAVAHYKVCRTDGSEAHSAAMVVHMDPCSIEGHPDMYEHECEHEWREVTKMRGRVAHKRAICHACGLRRRSVNYPEASLLRGRKVNYVEYRPGWWQLVSIQGESLAKLKKRVPLLAERHLFREDLECDVSEYVKQHYGSTIYFGLGVEFVIRNNVGTRFTKQCYVKGAA